LVVDDFYPDPDALVERVLASPWSRPPGVNYPGLVAPPFQDPAPVAERFSRLLGGVALRYRPPQGAFRVTTEGDMATRTSLVHIDSSDVSAVVYLGRTPSEGTCFYRHRRLGLDRIEPGDPRWSEVQVAITRDTLDPEAWELLDVIPMKYNRLLLFDGKQFHSGARRLTGETLAEGRMTQNFFLFYVSRPDGPSV
jgi:hypothetical protein